MLIYITDFAILMVSEFIKVKCLKYCKVSYSSLLGNSYNHIII